MKRFEAVIFDMDGVLVDSEPRHEEAFRDVFEEMGLGQTHGIEFERYYGQSDRVLWMDFIAKHRPKQTLDELVVWKERVFFEMLSRDEPIFESVPGLVSKLSERYPLAVASGSYHTVIDRVLALKNLRQYFRAIVSAQDVQRGKPAPDIFFLAAELLGVKAERCCVIEDSVAGVAGARAAGMQVIGITNSVPAGSLRLATKIVSSYAEIERLLLGEGEREVV